MKSKLGWLIGLLVIVRLLVMAFAPVFEPSESRYAAISANMARTGDYVVPHFTYKGVYQSFDGKPPLVFQAGGLFCELFGTENPISLQFAVRLFPFISALLLLAILYYATKSKIAVWVLATSCVFYVSAGLSMTDMSLATCVAGALLLYGMERPLNYLHRLAIGALLGAGMIIKGPVALAMFGLPVLVDCALNHNWLKLFDWRWLIAVFPFVAIALPWFILVEARNPGSVLYFFYNENFLRFVSHDYGDKYGAGREAFRGVSVLWALVVALPWPLMLLLPKNRPSGFNRANLKTFPFIAMATIIGFWALTSRVLLYYLIPIAPLFAAWFASVFEESKIRRFLLPAAIISMAAAVIMFAGGAAFSDKFRGAKTPFTKRGSSYAYEFYHGTPPELLK